ncbi:MAG: hypothetical protein L6Q71_11355 [Planctomycetes bacterium]|nr:hypothetical protein [Planctomycetota bacterium]NUQ36173.1 hypothetical protein [Planctomycetaceae bacterium]
MSRAFVIALVIAAAIAGRMLSESLIPKHKGRETVETASNQLLGGLRAVPMLTLWGKVRDAEERGQWNEQFVLFGIISKLAPNNAAIVYYQARAEALDVSRQQPTRAAAWNWVQQGLDRLTSKRERLGNASLIEEGVWDIVYNAGQRFPLQVAMAIAVDQDSKELEEQVLACSHLLEQAPTVDAFLETQGLTLLFDESPAYQSLSEDELRVLKLVEGARWQALHLAAKRGLHLRRGHSTDLAFKYLISLRRLGALSTDEQHDRSLREKAKDGLAEELARLRSLGEERRAREFGEHMNFLIGGWIRGEPEAAE